MIGRKMLENIWKEEWQLVLNQDVKEIDELNEIMVDGVFVEFEKANDIINDDLIDHCIYMTYKYKVIEGYNMTDKDIHNNDDLLDKIAILRLKRYK